MSAKVAKKKTRKKKRTRNKVGRPTRLTRAVLVAYVAIIADGNYRNTANAAMNLGEKTVRQWMRKGEEDLEHGRETLAAEFALSVMQAEALGECGHVANLKAGAMPFQKVIEQTEEVPAWIDDENKPGQKIQVMIRKTKRQTVIERGDWRASVEYLARKNPERWARRAPETDSPEEIGDKEHTLRLVQEGQKKLGDRFDHRKVGLA